eukprot:COSAG04_NODE_26935_length_289_cov_0.442105_2_plen_31_part_01
MAESAGSTRAAVKELDEWIRGEFEEVNANVE